MYETMRGSRRGKGSIHPTWKIINDYSCPFRNTGTDHSREAIAPRSVRPSVRYVDDLICAWKHKTMHIKIAAYKIQPGVWAIRTTSANAAKFHGIRPRMYIEDLL